ncbi:hypothetical protein O3W44_22870 [Pantoea sp. LMR881]|uniref:hypothetical protein n=1 Tax=Pantoea sp. LMR881 TaxID=3014336 RepID=UPI0022AE87A8|nr:hypothetical protein [Pantoea sp. LMR881]MCZ4061375.1 hypothetical protein [Pantoea sp. LMR881]
MPETAVAQAAENSTGMTLTGDALASHMMLVSGVKASNKTHGQETFKTTSIF